MSCTFFFYSRPYSLLLLLSRRRRRTRFGLSRVQLIAVLWKNSPLNLNVLKSVQIAIDGVTHKLVQACDTRWLSNEGIVSKWLF